MPGEPFRFLHASRLRLDEPLAGTGPLESDTRVVAEDATLTALENIVDACLAEGVEFLLLTGTTFGGDAPTLRARRALLTAFENLCEFEIQVFWEVGREELAGVDVPDNVTPIHAGDDEPVAVVRQGRVIASVASARRQESPQGAGEGTERDERSAFRIGLAGHLGADGADDPAYDYLALSGTGRRSTRRTADGVAHDPGPAQGTHAGEAGPHGATLVRVDADRAAELTAVPAAPVRWERLMVGVDRDLALDPLAERMQSALLELEPAPSERLWIVHWRLIGSGGLFDALQSGAADGELLDAVNRRLASAGDVRRVDRFSFRRRLAQHADELAQQIGAWIRDGQSAPANDVVRELSGLTGPPWLAAVTELLPGLDAARACDDAERLSQELLMRSAPSGTGQEQATP